MRLGVAKQKAKTTHKIQYKKKRGEWVELRFMAEAAEHDLPASKPFGDSENFDVVMGRPGKVCRRAGEVHHFPVEEWRRVCVLGVQQGANKSRVFFDRWSSPCLCVSVVSFF
jgi:hypothetical protein